jgi:hypothetical protein
MKIMIEVGWGRNFVAEHLPGMSPHFGSLALQKIKFLKVVRVS